MSTASPKALPATSRKPSASPTPARNASVRTATGTARTPAVSTPVARRRAPSKASTPVSQPLLLQVQDKEATIATLSTENKNLTSALNAAETRLHELYNEQSRWEMEMAQRIEVTDKLREQVREIEREKRDLQRRYNEQTSSFEAERQAFYDNEQHLKSRIQSLTQARKRAEAEAARVAEALTPVEPVAATDAQSINEPAPAERSPSQKADPSYGDSENEPRDDGS
ncbi:hypothetical protein NMY22_g1594 [Coprinellus aureogranulatus]|nr:hypothetical protein NMY22_g1594 [Coprinellus aureogranulatus]